jgi:hypothetical protein
MRTSTQRRETVQLWKLLALGGVFVCLKALLQVRSMASCRL